HRRGAPARNPPRGRAALDPRQPADPAHRRAAQPLDAPVRRRPHRGRPGRHRRGDHPRRREFRPSGAGRHRRDRPVPDPAGPTMTRTWRITTVTDAARARIALARLAAERSLPAVQRARLATTVSERLRQCLTKGGTWLLTLDTARAGGTTRLHLVLTPPQEARDAGEPPWEVTVACPGGDAPAAA